MYQEKCFGKQYSKTTSTSLVDPLYKLEMKKAAPLVKHSCTKHALRLFTTDFRAVWYRSASRSTSSSVCERTKCPQAASLHQRSSCFSMRQARRGMWSRKYQLSLTSRHYRRPLRGYCSGCSHPITHRCGKAGRQRRS